MNNNISQIIEGKQYPTLVSVAEAYGTSKTRIYKRHSRGKRRDDLVPVELRENYRPLTVQDKSKFEVGKLKFINVADACRQLKVNHNKYQGRIRNGWCVEEALGLVPRDEEKLTRDLNSQRREKRKSLIAFGKRYDTYKKLSEAFGIKEYVLYQRINKYGKSPEEAVLMNGKNKKIKIGNKEFESQAECARTYYIEPNTFYHLRKKYSIEEIIGLKNRTTSRSIIYNGKWYESLLALAKDYGLSKNKFNYRYYVCKLSLDTLLNIPPNSSVVNSVYGNEAKFYIAELSIGRKKFYKVGVTQYSLEKRFRELPFNCKTVLCKNGELHFVKKIEKIIKDRLQENRATDFSAKDFDGFTEVYRLNTFELNKLKFF